MSGRQLEIGSEGAEQDLVNNEPIQEVDAMNMDAVFFGA